MRFFCCCLVCLLVVFASAGCVSVPCDRGANQEIGNNINGIQDQQRETESGITGAEDSGRRIEDGINGIESIADEIERIVGERDSIDGDFERELQELKTAAAALRTESTELNQQLTKSKESLVKEIQSTDILKKNWQAYEAEKSKEIAAMQKENHELNKKIAFIRGFLVASSIIIVGLSIALFCISWKNRISRF